jgi:hypothetical protein
MNPLFRELLAAGRLGQSPPMRPILDRVGLPVPSLGGWGIDWVEPDADGRRYRPAAEGGRVAAIFRVDYEDALVDLCAVSLETRAIRVRRGLCELLGAERLEVGHRFGWPITVFADPIEWFLAGKRGVVVLDWRHGLRDLLDMPALACADEALAAKLHRALSCDGFETQPPIFVRSSLHQETPDVRPIHPAAARLCAIRRGERRLAGDRADAA